MIKDHKSKKPNENRQNYEIGTKYTQAAIKRSKSKNPYRKTGRIKQIDKKQYNENNRGQNVTHNKSKFIMKEFLIIAKIYIRPTQPNHWTYNIYNDFNDDIDYSRKNRNKPYRKQSRIHFI